MSIERAFRIFVSYSRSDATLADQIVSALEAQGYEVTIDRRDLPYGEEWQKELAHFIQTADTTIWLVSPKSVVSRWCLWELGEVQRLNKRLIPVVVQAIEHSDLPEALGKLHLLPPEGEFSLSEDLTRLLHTLEADNQWLKDHTHYAEQARVWQANDRTSDQLLRGSALESAEAWREKKPLAAPAPSQATLDLILSSRQHQSTRQRKVVFGAITVSLFALALAVFSLVQRNEAITQSQIAEAQTKRALEQQNIAEEQRVLAQQNEAIAREQEALADQRATEAEIARQRAQQALDEATNTASSVVLKIAEEFRHIGLPSSISKQVLEEARLLQDQLAQHAEDDPKLNWSRTAALGAMADTLKAQGDTLASIDVYQDSIQLAKTLPTIVSGYGDSRELHIVMALKLGDALREVGELEKAKDSYLTVANLALDIKDAHPESFLAYFNHSGALMGLGDIERTSGSSKAALQAYQEALRLNQEAFLRSEEDQTALAARTLLLSRLADMHQMSGNIQETVELLAANIEILNDLSTEHPENTLWKENLAVNWLALANSLTAVPGRYKERTEQAHEYSQQILEDLLAKDSTNSRWQELMATSHLRLGDIDLKAGDSAAAFDHYSDSYDISYSLYSSYPGQPKLIKSMLELTDRLSSVLWQLGKTDTAITLATSQIHLANELSESSLGDEWLLQIAWSEVKSGLLLLDDGQEEEAAEAFAMGKTRLSNMPEPLGTIASMILAIALLGEASLSEQSPSETEGKLFEARKIAAGLSKDDMLSSQEETTWLGLEEVLKALLLAHTK